VRWRAPAAGALALALLTGCAQSVDPIERLGEKAAQRVRHPSPAAADRAYRHWGLAAPLLPAPKPVRPRPAPRALPVVVSQVSTPDRVVFLTYEDAAERDPSFVAMVRELRLPVSVFLADSVAAPGYAHADRLRAAGASIQNRTLDHRSLRGLSYAAQHVQICGQQDRLRSRFGTRPRLLRPPHGAYDTTTLRAAADCGITALVRWRATLTPTGDLTYTNGTPRLHPGDIVTLPPGLPQRDLTSHLLSRVQEAGLTVGRLEDYV
jgi:peptidoglycan/xylan/chitin deacetylase (PgdA/CDA1 family)